MKMRRTKDVNIARLFCPFIETPPFRRDNSCFAYNKDSGNLKLFRTIWKPHPLKNLELNNTPIGIYQSKG
jgi:hypothetical protein